MMSDLTLLLIRHGQIRANTVGRWHGATDSPLTSTGRRQVARLAAHLSTTVPGLDAIYSSPLARCRDTAGPLAGAFGCPVRVDDDLREYGIGELEDLTVKALHEQHDFFNQIFTDPDYAPTGGDSINTVAARVTAALTRIHKTHEQSRCIAVVSHGAALGVALASLLDEDPSRWRNYHVANCSMTELRLAPKPMVTQFNRVTH